MGESWAMWALRSEDIWPSTVGEFAYTFPDRWYPEAHGDASAVPVMVTITEEGPYWAWMETPDDRKPDPFPEFIWHFDIPFRMCFPYGPEAEEKGGKGRIVRVRVEEVVALRRDRAADPWSSQGLGDEIPSPSTDGVRSPLRGTQADSGGSVSGPQPHQEGPV